MNIEIIAQKIRLVNHFSNFYVYFFAILFFSFLQFYFSVLKQKCKSAYFSLIFCRFFMQFCKKEIQKLQNCANA